MIISKAGLFPLQPDLGLVGNLHGKSSGVGAGLTGRVDGPSIGGRPLVPGCRWWWTPFQPCEVGEAKGSAKSPSFTEMIQLIKP